MKLSLLYKQVKYKLSRLNRLKGFQPAEWLKGIGFIIIIVGLTINIWNSYEKGLHNSKVIAQEEAKLAKLEDENQDLTEQVQYYSSIEYKRIYARENQNLAEPGERLYFIERDDEELVIDYIKEETDKIELQNNSYWWKKLILGL